MVHHIHIEAMIDAIDILTYPFFVRALLAGFMIAILCASFGVFVVLRKMSFFGEGVAHASLAGIAIGILAAVDPLPVALVYAVLVSIGILVFTRYSKLASDTVIGVLFSLSMALGIVLIGFFQGYTPDLITFLFGNVLSISTFDVLLVTIVGAVLLFLVLYYYPQLVFATFDRDAAQLSGVRTLYMDVLLHALLAIVIVLAVKLVGIVLVSALLVVPAATSVLFNKTFLGTVMWSIFLSVASVIVGLFASVLLNVASGGMIVLVAGGIFLSVFFGRRILRA